MGKFNYFAKGLLTNRLGIVLATLNICYFAAKSHASVYLPLNVFDKIMLAQNLPAGFVSFVAAKNTEFFFHATSWLSFQKVWLPFLLFFVTLQWLFIGWSAKMIARKVRRRKV